MSTGALMPAGFLVFLAGVDAGVAFLAGAALAAAFFAGVFFAGADLAGVLAATAFFAGAFWVAMLGSLVVLVPKGTVRRAYISA
jgi:hypothetical protein